MSQEQYLFHLGTVEETAHDGVVTVKPNLWLLGKEDLPPLLFTPEDVAKTLSIGRPKVYDLIREGKLRSIKVGASRRITARALVECVADLEAAGDSS
jgi:excisionase family DNA binding protein